MSSSSLSTPECGTEWWCPVVANEAVLRWGLLLVVVSWVLTAEWKRYQKTRPLIQLFQSKLPWCEGFEFDTEKVASAGAMAAIGFVFQFAYTERGPVSLEWKWAIALTVCGGVLCLFLVDELEAPGSFLFAYSTIAGYRVCPRSAQGPFLLFKVNMDDGYTDKEFATVDDLVASVAKPKSD